MHTAATKWGKYGFMTCASCGHIVITYGRNDIKEGHPAYCHFCHRQFISKKDRTK